MEAHRSSTTKHIYDFGGVIYKKLSLFCSFELYKNNYIYDKFLCYNIADYLQTRRKEQVVIVNRFKKWTRRINVPLLDLALATL